MATTKEDIRQWLEEGNEKGATHMIVVLDTFDYEDYPVYVSMSENVGDNIAKYSNPNEMSRVIEVYSYKLPLEPQIKENRAWHLD
jgi:hypothetical protein